MRTNIKVRVYHVGGPLRRYMAWLIFGPFAAALAVAGALSKGGDQAGAWIMAGFLVFVGLGVHWLVSRARLEVSAVGVKLRQIGYILETPWTNVESLRMDKGHEGFVTKEPMKGRGPELLSSTRGTAFGIGRMPIYDHTARELLYQQRYIPIEAFAWHVRHGHLGDELKRLAPHVSTVTGEWMPRAKLTPEQQRKNIIGLAMVFGCMALLLGAAFFFPAVTFRHVLPGLWAVVTTCFAVQGCWLARIAIRTGPKWLAVLYILYALAMGLWSLTVWGETFSGHAPPKPADHSAQRVK